jgi:glycerophosphoryl diester phosphodiesterase
MRDYPDIWIVTDTKYKDPEMVNKQFTIMKETALKADALDVFDRFIVQLYSEEMHEAVEAVYPFEPYIFTMYQRWFGDDEAEFTKNLQMEL